MQQEQEYLSFSEVKEGFKKNMKVIKRLLRDAELCHEKSYYSSTVALSILALEEISKADFMRRRINEAKGISKKEWKELTLGRGSHIIKLSLPLRFKEQQSERWSEEGIQYLNKISQKFGLPIYYPNRNAVKKEIDMFKKIVPKFNILKQLCFYTTWDEKNKRWIYFENRFNDLLQESLSDYFFFEAKKDYLNLKFALEIPRKTFETYTKDDWEFITKLKARQELSETMKLAHKKITPNFVLLMKTLDDLTY